MNEKVKNVLKGISHTGYTTEIERTEARLLIEDLYKENKQLKEQLEKERKVRKKGINKIKTLGKFDGEKCTRGLKLWGADFNELISILDIDKGE